LDEQFGFLLDSEQLCYGDINNDIKQNCLNLADFYKPNIDGDHLFQEILDVRMLLKTSEKISAPIDLLKFIIQYGENVFSDLKNALTILLAIAVSIASCERSFSKLKLILNYLRASMLQDRLCDLAQLSIESEQAEQMDFKEVINDFVLKRRL
jgi:hypothetical protein